MTKINLDKLEQQTLRHGCGYASQEEVLALVAAVRAARSFCLTYAAPHAVHALARQQMQDALAPFTDSSEVRSDGE